MVSTTTNNPEEKRTEIIVGALYNNSIRHASTALIMSYTAFGLSNMRTRARPRQYSESRLRWAEETNKLVLRSVTCLCRESLRAVREETRDLFSAGKKIIFWRGKHSFALC